MIGPFMSFKFCFLMFFFIIHLYFILYYVYASISLIVKVTLNNNAFVDMKQENTYVMHTISFK